jgi:hypothetical protein
MALLRIRTITSGIPGSPFLTTHYFDSLFSNANSAADAVQLFWEGLVDVISVECSMDVELDVATIDPTTGAITDMEPGAAHHISGGANGELASAATQGLMRLNTGVVAGGRVLKGRLFIPGVTEGSGAAAPFSTYQTVVEDAGTAVIDDEDSQWVVWSKVNGVYAAVQAATCWNQYAVLRSRRD